MKVDIPTIEDLIKGLPPELKRGLVIFGIAGITREDKDCWPQVITAWEDGFFEAEQRLLFLMRLKDCAEGENKAWCLRGIERAAKDALEQL